MVDETRQPEPGGRLTSLLGKIIAAVVVFRALSGSGGNGPAPAAPPPEGGESPPPGGLAHPSVRYETSDVKFRWVLGLMIVAMTLAAVLLFALLLFFRDYASYEARVKASQYPLATDNGRLPAEPRLEQINRLADIEKGNVYLREESKERVLNSYGAVEGEDGFVHVPVGKAMDYLAQQNRLPSRDGPPEGARKKQNGLVDGGGPNSGRLLREDAP